MCFARTRYRQESSTTSCPPRQPLACSGQLGTQAATCATPSPCPRTAPAQHSLINAFKQPCTPSAGMAAGSKAPCGGLALSSGGRHGSGSSATLAAKGWRSGSAHGAAQRTNLYGRRRQGSQRESNLGQASSPAMQ